MRTAQSDDDDHYFYGKCSTNTVSELHRLIERQLRRLDLEVKNAVCTAAHAD